MSDLFDNNKFEKLNNFAIEPHLISYRQLLRETIGKTVNNIKLLNLNPTYTIAECYGTLKLHREGLPLRPICTGYLSFTNNVEEYIKNIISPLISECKFLVSSTKQFKERFLVEKEQFNPSKHKLLSFDITKLYPSVNVTRVISYILELLYKNPNKFFPDEYDSEGNLYPKPRRQDFLKLLHETLTKYSIFRTSKGV